MTEDKIPFEEKDILKLIDLTFHLAAHKLDYDCGGMIDDLKWFDHTNKDTVNERQTILDQMKEMPEWKKILEDTKKAAYLDKITGEVGMTQERYNELEKDAKKAERLDEAIKFHEKELRGGRNEHNSVKIHVELIIISILQQIRDGKT